MSDIFISYAREDTEAAKRLAAELEVRGWSVFWDRRIPAGRRFAEFISEKLDASKCVITLWSKAANASDWVQEEAEEAKKLNKLVPVLIEEVDPPWGFRRIQAANLVQWQGEAVHEGFKQLLRDIAQYVPAHVAEFTTRGKSEQETARAQQQAEAKKARKEAKTQAKAEADGRAQQEVAEERRLRTERERHNLAADEQAKAPAEKHTSGFHSRGARFFSDLRVWSIVVACSILIVVSILYRAYERGSKLPNYPTGTIEMKYYAPGSWAVTEETGGPCCDSLGNKYDLYYPTPLGAGGFKHPILTWGNGSLEKPSQVAYLLKHMASWGFVVIASEDQMTGPGQSILDAAKFLVSANSDSTSIFFGKLDVSQVGAFGHSQGAGGAINALIKSGGLIKTVIPIELLAQISCGPTPCPDTSRLTTGSVFFIDGSSDIPKSPPTQPPGTPGEQSIEAYYHAVPRGVAKVKGTLIGPGPNDVTGQPDCSTAVPPCENGVYGYLGYPTAWMMYQLQNDNYAHGAFVNQTGEMFSQVVNWAFVASNIP